MRNSDDFQGGSLDSTTPPCGNAPLLLQLRGIRKSFPGVQALTDASFELYAGEIHALVGENGAGKSTLIKVLTGAHQPDAGNITIAGECIDSLTLLQARSAGIAAIYQEFVLVPSLSVRANLFLGRERAHFGFISSAGESASASAVLMRLGVAIDEETRIADLSVAQQQMVEIARALACDAKILLMDEPTAALSTREVESLFNVLRDLAASRIGIVFVSHRLEEVFTIADRITVMRDGKTIDTRQTADYTRNAVIEQMVGRSLAEEYPKVEVARGEVRFDVRKLSGGRIKDVSFRVKRGEVLGIAGLMGSGRTQLARLIFGADRRSSGEISLDGRLLEINSPRDAIKNGICLLTEDRKMQGLILKATARENFSLPNLSRWSRWSWIDRRQEKARFFEQVGVLGIRLTGADQRVENLSGGNQQKLLLARWLETDSQVFVFDEPTRGIDVAAKYEMYLLIGELAVQGKMIIMISSELAELLGVCDRLIVMRHGRITGEIQDVRQARQEDIMSLAI